MIDGTSEYHEAVVRPIENDVQRCEKEYIGSDLWDRQTKEEENEKKNLQV